jgi:polysaccharide pyruvyl transferase WcaK-like protein
MKKIRVIAYGAVAEIPAESGVITSFRKRFRLHWDRLAAQRGASNDFDYRNHVAASTYNRGDFAIMQASLQALHNANRKLEPIPTDWETLDQSKTDTAALVVCGSGYFFLDGKFRFPARLRTDLEFIKARNIPVVVYGAGVNLVDANLTIGIPHLPETEKAFLSDFLAHCSHISVRDETSQYLLQSCTSKAVKLIGDPALFIETNFTHTHKFPKAAGPKIGINIPFHGPAAGQRIKEDLPIYITTLKKIQAETNCHFYFMVHYDTEVLITRVIEDAGVILTVVDGDVDTLLNVYRQLNIHIGGMLHSCILSASTGTPCIGLAYDIKHTGFFDLMGISDFCVPAQPFDSEKVLALAQQALKHERQMRELILQKRAALAIGASQFLEAALSDINMDVS